MQPNILLHHFKHKRAPVRARKLRPLQAVALYRLSAAPGYSARKTALAVRAFWIAVLLGCAGMVWLSHTP
jgi:hypothetical protein